jgi:hypothetical protein
MLDVAVVGGEVVDGTGAPHRVVGSIESRWSR